MNKTGGVGLLTILTVIFVIAKIAGFIAWPWIAVLAPAIISVTAKITFVIAFLIIAYFAD